MKISNRHIYPFSFSMSEDLAKHCKKEQVRDLFAELHDMIELNRRYSMMLSETLDEDCEVGVTICTFYIDCDPAIEKKIVRISPEEMYFKPSKGFIEKLKNCIRYLRDKTGGMLAERSEND